MVGNWLVFVQLLRNVAKCSYFEAPWNLDVQIMFCITSIGSEWRQSHTNSFVEGEPWILFRFNVKLFYPDYFQN